MSSFDLDDIPLPNLDGIKWSDSEEDDFSEEKPPKSTYIPPEAPTNENELFTVSTEVGQCFEAHEQLDVQISGNNKPTRVKNFVDLKLHPSLQLNINKCKFDKLTPIQSIAIPVLLENRNLMACAETGSGKTAAYLVPIVNAILKNQLLFYPSSDDLVLSCPTALIIVPTRELSSQIWIETLKYTYQTEIKTALLYGKTSVEHQKLQLKRGNIVIATLGRLKHFFNCKFLDFSELQFFVLDEAEKMLDLGFGEEIREMFHEIMKQKSNKPPFQTAMFSATFSNQIRNLASEFLDNHIFVTIGQFGGTANKDIYQKLLEVDQNDKIDLLIKILVTKPMKTMVFVDKKTSCDYVAEKLASEGISVECIHSDRSQPEREEALLNFKKGTKKILIASSVASRGLEIPGVARVINYDLPSSIEEYIYRIGRTGRLGNKGYAISFYDASLNSRLQKKLLQVFTECDQIVPSFLHDENHLWKKKKWDALKLNFTIDQLEDYKLKCEGHHIDYKQLWY